MIAVLARDGVFYYGLVMIIIHTVQLTLWSTRRGKPKTTKPENLNH